MRLVSVTLILCLLLSAAPIAGFQELIVLTPEVSAASEPTFGTCGENLTWTLDGDGALTIEGTGAMTDYDYGRSPFAYNNSIKTVRIEKGVSNVGDNAFYGCAGLTSVSIRDGVARIGNTAFYCCAKLWELTLPNSLKEIGRSAFYKCESLSAVVLPEGLTTVGGFAFNHCAALSFIYLPDSVKTVGSGAFYGCSDNIWYMGSVNQWTDIDNPSGYQPKTYECYVKDGVLYTERETVAYKALDRDRLTDVTLLPTVTRIEDYAFSGCMELERITVPDSVKTIGHHAFSSCSGLTEAALGDGVERIGDNAFYFCSRLTSVTFGKNLQCIGEFAFCFCSGLTSLTLPDSVVSIGFAAFSVCSGLQTLSFGSSVKEIGDSAFYYCAGLKPFLLPQSVERIGEFAFNECSEQMYYTGTRDQWAQIGNPSGFVPADYRCVFRDGVIFKDDMTVALKPVDPESFNELLLPETVISIAPNAFYNCYGLTSITIPDSVEIIGDNAFGYCVELTSAVIGNGVKRIGDHAFFNCVKLSSLSIGNSVESIDDCAFCYCTSLPSITLPSGLKHIGNSAFGCCSALTALAIPDGVQTVGDSAFYFCNGLSNVFIPISVTELGNYAFFSTYPNVYYGGTEAQWALIDNPSAYEPVQYHCDLIDGVIYQNNVTTALTALDPASLTGVSFPDTVETVCDGAFSGCEHLTDVTIPDSVKEIGPYAFSYCISLHSVDLGDGVKTIGDHAFYCNGGLSEVRMGKSVETVGAYAFCYCGGIGAIAFPESLRTIEDGAFACCTGLTSVILPDGLETVCISAFYFCSRVFSIILPQSVKSIGEAAFFGCDGGICYTGSSEEWEQIENPGGFTPVEFDCFVQDGVLYNGDATCAVTATKPETFTDAYLLSTVTRLLPGAFYGCCEMKKIVIPESVTDVSDAAFTGCASLADVYFLGTQAQWNEMFCGEGNEDLKKALLHLHSHAFTKNVILAPTCISAGSADMTCGECGYTCVEELAPTGEHNWNDGETTVSPTYEKEGERTFTCTVCGATKTQPIDRLTVPVIDSETAKEIGGSVYTAPGLKAGELLAVAGEGAKLTGPEGGAVGADETAGSGMVLTKADGNDYTLIVKGDNDGDGIITAADARFALRIAVELESPEDWQLNASLVSGGTAVTAADARLILRAAVGLETLVLL